MNRALGYLCAHISWTGPGEPPEEDEMNEMTLSSRHRIRNSIPGGLRPSMLPLGHGGSPQYFHTWMEKNHFCFFQTAQTGNRTPNTSVKGSGANHCPRAPALATLQFVWYSLVTLTWLLHVSVASIHCSFTPWIMDCELKMRRLRDDWLWH